METNYFVNVANWIVALLTVVAVWVICQFPPDKKG